MPLGPPIPRPMRLVAFLAVLPLPVLLVLTWMAPGGLAPALLSYVVLIAAMLGGAHWLVAAGPYGRARIASEGLSGLAVLIAAWVALLAPAYLGFLIAIAVFFLLILRDTLAEEASDLPGWFARWRAYIAAGAAVTCILGLFRVLAN